ncbi:hypothetical protein [Rhodococcus sovatensis]|uniref:Uncharacterized protein n=1 Tax=Rhodococcus sovatensis TaxID=1805840 RepID=A0ABZ2PED9_9NOCA
MRNLRRRALEGRCSALVCVVLLGLALVSGKSLVGYTAALWTDSEYVAGTVGSGSWVTNGYGLGIGPLVNSAGGISILPDNPTPLPWDSARSGRDSTNPGTATVAGTGPFASSAVVMVNQLRMSGASASTAPVGAAACGSYVVGAAGVPTYCTTGTPTASASATVSSMRLTGSVVGVSLLGVISLVNTDIVAVSSAGQTITTSVGCQLDVGTNVWTVPAAANTTTANPNGSVLVGGRSVRIPSANSTTSPGSFTDGLVGYTNVALTSSQSPTGAAAGFSRLTLTGSVSLLALGVLPLTFSIDLVSAECGPGATPAAATAAQPMARGAAPAAVTTTPEVPSTPDAPSTTDSPSTTASSITTEEAAVAQSPEVTTTTEVPTTTEAPIETVDPPLSDPPADPPLDTAKPTPPESATVFTGPIEGNVESLTFDGGLVCSAPAGSDYTGTVELSCSDGSSIGAPGSALTPDGVAEATVEGVWAPVLTPGGTAQHVIAATRR